MIELILLLCVATHLLNQIFVAGLLGENWQPRVIKATDKLLRITIAPLLFLPALFSWLYLVTVGGEAYRELLRDYFRYVDEKEEDNETSLANAIKSFDAQRAELLGRLAQEQEVSRKLRETIRIQDQVHNEDGSRPYLGIRITKAGWLLTYTLLHGRVYTQSGVVTPKGLELRDNGEILPPKMDRLMKYAPLLTICDAMVEEEEEKGGNDDEG